MKKHEDRVEKHIYLYLQEKNLRKVANKSGWSTSTVHMDLILRAPVLFPELYQKTKEQLAYNDRIKHRRGGMSTKEKWLKLKREEGEIEE